MNKPHYSSPAYFNPVCQNTYASGAVGFLSIILPCGDVIPGAEHKKTDTHDDHQR